MEGNKRTSTGQKKTAAMKTLVTAKELYVLMSVCTKVPFVMCDPETYDDEVFVYEKEEDIKREGKRFIDQKIPLQIAKVENKQLLGFYTNLCTMGINCVVLNGFMSTECKVELDEIIKRPQNNAEKGQIWIENPNFHLTAIYLMQEVRRQKVEKMTDEIKELQEEILAHYKKGTYIAVVDENNGIPLLKLPNGDTFQPVFTDIFELRKFNRDKKYKPVPVRAEKVTDILAADAKGIVVNPLGVNLLMPIQRRQAGGQASEKNPDPKNE